MNSRTAQNVIPEVERVLRATEYLRQCRQLQTDDMRTQLDNVLVDFREYKAKVQQKMDELETRLVDSLNATANQVGHGQQEQQHTSLETVEAKCTELQQDVSNSEAYQNMHSKLQQLHNAATLLPPIFTPRHEACSKLNSLRDIEATLDELAKQVQLETPSSLVKVLYELHGAESNKLKTLRRHAATSFKIEAVDQHNAMVLCAAPIAESGLRFEEEMLKALCLSDCRNRKLKRFSAFENRCEILYEATCDVGAFCVVRQGDGRDVLALLEVEKPQAGSRKHVVQLLSLDAERPVPIENERYVLQDSSRYQDSCLFVRQLGANGSANQSGTAATASSRAYLYVAVFDFSGVHELEVTTQHDSGVQLHFSKVHTVAQNVKLRCVSYAKEWDLLACSCSDNRVRVMQWLDRDLRQLALWEPTDIKNSYVKQVLVVKRQRNSLVLLVEDFAANDKCIVQCVLDLEKRTNVTVVRLTHEAIEVDFWTVLPNRVLADLLADNTNRHDNQQLLVFSSIPVTALTVYQLS